VLDGLYPLFVWGVGPTIFPWRPVAVAAVLVIAITVPLALWRTHYDGSRGLFLAATFVGTLSAAVLVYQFYTLNRSLETIPTRAVSAMPFFLLLVAAGLDRLRRPARLVGLAVLTAASATGIFNYFVGRDFHNPIYLVPTRQIARTIETRLTRDDVIVAESDTIVGYYLDQRADRQLVTIGPTESAETGALDRLRRAVPKRIWLVTFGRDITRGRRPARLEAWISDRYAVTSTDNYVPTPRVYARFKQAAQDAPSYQYKATVRLYTLK
jgi:hypothetical protein